MLYALGAGNSTQCGVPSPEAAMSKGERGGKVMGRCTGSHGCIGERESISDIYGVPASLQVFTLP